VSPTTLQSRTPEEYGERYQDHLLEQYKLFVETSQHTSDKRQNANNYLLTLCSTLVTLFVAFLSTFGHHRLNVLIPVAGIFVCFIWWSMVNSYKALNTAKFKVIHEMEEQLPVALFDYEWHVCGKGKDREKYIPLTHLERMVPWMFGGLFVVLALYSLLAQVDKKPEPTQTSRPIAQAAPQQKQAPAPPKTP
jgi:hypothetical protein